MKLSITFTDVDNIWPKKKKVDPPRVQGLLGVTNPKVQIVIHMSMVTVVMK